MKIKIQQNNSVLHCSVDNEDIVHDGTENWWHIRMIFQLPNSPDFNVRVLDFFNPIQSLQHKECQPSVDELIVAVYKASDKITTEKLDKLFIILEKCMELTMFHKGGNDYNPPYMRKDKLRLQKTLFRTRNSSSV